MPQTPPTCPGCGAALTAVDVSRRPDTPPWLCGNCSRGWWNAELSARGAYDPILRDFGHSSQKVHQGAKAERDKQVEAAS